MKVFVLGLAVMAFLLTVDRAAAGVHCWWSGNVYYCNDTEGNNSSCRVVGRNVYCN